MVGTLSTVLTFVALGCAAWAVVLIIAGRPLMVDRWHGVGLLGLVVLLELGLLGQLVVGVVALFGDHPVDAPTFVGYLIGVLLVLPLAVFWALGERTRWGPGVLVIGCLTVPVLIVRLRQLWEAAL